MADAAAGSPVLDALLRELAAQGQAGAAGGGGLRAYPVKGTIDLLALAEAAESALGAGTSDDEEAKTPAELNAANDG